MLDDPKVDEEVEARLQKMANPHIKQSTLRDQFSMAAPITMVDALKYNAGEEETYEQVFRRLAWMRYSYADEMLKAREKVK